MPSPFSGMDPFLERPARWPSVHQRYITYLADAINPLLPENYVADIGEGIHVTSLHREMLEAAREFLADAPLSELCRALFNVNEFVYLD